MASKSAQIGLGVSLGEVRRAFNAYLAQSANSAESKFQSATRFVEAMARLENAILPTEGDLASQITQFFAKLADISANPGDLAPRAAAIEQAAGLANGFNVTSQIIGELRDQIRQSIDEEIAATNRLSESIASVNSRLRASNLGSAPPNALLDERDRLISQLSQKVLISVEYGSRHEANVTFGRFTQGPVLVNGDRSVPLQAIHNDTSGTVFRLGIDFVFKSVDDGAIKGLTSSLSVIESTFQKLDLLAIRVVEELNALHTSGIDYDGQRGKELFTAKQFEVNLPASNSKQLDVTLLQVPGKIDALSEMTFKYSAATDHWTAYNIDGSIVGEGRKEIDLGGMVVKVNTPARDGDGFNVSRVSGEAGRIKFLLSDGKEIAAASNFVITPASINTGSAVLTSRMIEENPPDLESVLDVTTNSISPVAFTEFRSGGVVGYIPANADSVDLASFGQSPIIEFNFSSTEGVGSFSVAFGGTQYTFPSEETRSTLVPLAEDGQTSIKLKSDMIAEYLNDGIIKSSSGHTLKELGLFASGFEGGLKITGITSFTSGTLTTQDGATTNAIVRDSTQPSGFRVFTREGRQIAGQPLSNAEASLLITEENGFRDNAIYRADYLNAVGGMGYRGAEITNLRPDGYFTTTSVTSLINNGDLTRLIRKNPAVNGLSAQTVTVTTSDGLVESVVNVKAGASAKDTAAKMNVSLMEVGFLAEAQTIVSLELDSGAATNGRVTFSFELEDGQSIGISADYSDKNLSPLVDQINRHQTKTGVQAEVSTDGSRVLIIDRLGNDINLANFSGSTLNANALDQSYKKLLTTDVTLDEATKFAGTVELKSPRAFTFQTSLGGFEVAADSALLSGGIGRSFSAAGSVTDFEWQISPDLLAPQASPDGLRLSTSSAEFSMKAKLNGTSQDLNLNLNSSELSDYRSSAISKVFIDRARQWGTVPSLNGSLLSALPPEGSTMSVRVGGSTYQVLFKGGVLSVNGPEDQRLLASLEKTNSGQYKVSLAAPAGTMSGRTIEVLNNTDAAKFGLATTNSGSEVILRGRAFELASGTTKSFDVTLGTNTVTITASYDGSQYTLTSSDANLQFVSPNPTVGNVASLTIDPSLNTPLISLVSTQSNGPISVIPSATAKDLGFQAGNFDFEVTSEGFRVISSDGQAAEIELDVSGLPGQILSMKNLPA
ncbi:MAG: FlgK family flagellar hook-associated protein, partial [Alphaproteobacteria bacterium]